MDAQNNGDFLATRGYGWLITFKKEGSSFLEITKK